MTLQERPKIKPHVTGPIPCKSCRRLVLFLWDGKCWEVCERLGTRLVSHRCER